MSRVQINNNQWISLREAMRILGTTSFRRVHRLADAGSIRVLDPPGVSRRYNRRDAETLAKQAPRRPKPARPTATR